MSEQMMGFDAYGKVVNYEKLMSAQDEKLQKHQPSTKQISEQSAKIITFYDLAGHEKYLKTTVLGVCFAQHWSTSVAGHGRGYLIVCRTWLVKILLGGEGGPLSPCKSGGGVAERGSKGHQLISSIQMPEILPPTILSGGGGECMFSRHNPPPPVPVTGNAGTCRNVLPECCDSVSLFSENACLWCLALVAWGPFTWAGGGFVEI